MGCSPYSDTPTFQPESVNPVETARLETDEVLFAEEDGVELIDANIEQRFSSPELDAVDTSRGNVMMAPGVCLSPDPHIDTASGNPSIFVLSIVNEIHEGLTRIAYDDTGRVENALAESIDFSDDGRRVEIRLRKELKFSDGSPLTTTDVKWSWERSLWKSTPWSRASDVLGAIEGADDIVGRDVAGDLRGVRIIDTRNMVVDLKVPRSDFRMLLADPTAYVLKRENVESWHVRWTNDVLPGGIIAQIAPESVDVTATGEGISVRESFGDNIPVGAGPFKLNDYVAVPTDDGIPCSLVRNDFYWDQPSQLDGVRVSQSLQQFSGGSGDIVAEFRAAFDAGIIDFAYYSPATVPTNPDDLVEAKVETVGLPPYTWFLALNPDLDPLDDLNLRLALVLATDLEKFWEPYGSDSPRTLVPATLSGNYESCEGPDTDIDEARSLIQRSEYINGTGDRSPIDYWSLVVNGDSWRMETLFSNWDADLGVKVTHHDPDAHDTTDEPEDVLQIMRRGTVGMRDIEVAPSYPDLHTIFRPMIATFGDSSPVGELHQLELMITAASVEQDAVVRMERYRRIECHIHQRGLVLPLTVSRASFKLLFKPWVHGYKYPLYNRSVFYKVWFDETAPERELP